MKNIFKKALNNVYEGTILGMVIMVVVVFIMALGTYWAIMILGNCNGRICNYSGKFWVDDSKDKNREGDLKGCFTWEEMVELERL